MNQLPDACRRKHRGTDTSEDANARAHGSKANQQQTILFLLEARGTLTLAEAVAEIGKPMNALSPRFSELRDAGLIERNGERRGGCGVWRLVARLSCDESGQGLMFGGARP
jgi:hypothetical protein